MKKLLVCFALISAILMSGCKRYTELRNHVGELEERVTALEELCKQMNTNISSLQTLVNALQENDWITAVNPINYGGETIGYMISFAKNDPITIYHGQNGKDGYTPQIGIRQDTDGHYYWTLDGEWLLGSNGQKILAEGTSGKDGQNGADGKDGQDGKDGKNGKDGITPQFKIEEGNWYISVDGGKTWEYLGRATGENGQDGQNGTDGKDGADGDSFFSNVDTSNPDYVVFTLADGTEIILPRQSGLSISFSEDELVAMRPNSTRSIGYTISGSTDNLSIEVLSSGDVKAKYEKADETTGTITIVTGASVDEYSRVVVLVSNGRETIMRSLSFEELGLRVTNGSVYEVSSEGGIVEIHIETNAAYTVLIPGESQNWIRTADTKAWISETVSLYVDKNESGEKRSAIIDLTDDNGVPFESIVITQGKDCLTTDMIKAFPDPVFRQYLLDNFDTDKDGIITADEALNVTRISVRGSIASLEGIQYFTNLTSLDCRFNQLTSLDISNKTALVSLSCGNNQLTSLDVSGCTSLTNLDCINNKLTNIGMSQNTALSHLNCCFNQITNMNINDCIALEELYLTFNQLTSLDVSNNTVLADLNVGGNQLGSLDISNNTALTELVCAQNQLTSLDLSNNTALTYLWCSQNQLTSLDVSLNTALTYLRCEQNQLTSLDVSTTNIGSNTSDEYPLQCNMPTLKTLTLKTGWIINGINLERNSDYIDDDVVIKYAN